MRRSRPFVWLPAVSLACSLILPVGAPPRVLRAHTVARPNIVLIMTDDQRFDSLWAMPHVRRLMANGITFRRAFVTNSLCCPSRASILTGGFSHTTRVYTNVYTKTSPYGGFKAFRRAGDESGTIAVALHDVGYRTALIGKYLNSYSGPHVPPGWDVWAAFSGIAEGGAYYRYRMYVHTGSVSRMETFGSTPTDYSTTVIQRKALHFLRATPPDTPLFLEVTPYAPHFALVPAPGDAGSFEGVVDSGDLPASFDEADVSDKPPYIRRSRPLSEAATEDRLELQYEVLRSVDRLVGAIVDELRASGRSGNTLLVFMSDNGIQYGEHRWLYKLVPYEESIRIPLVVRYKPVTAAHAGAVSSSLVSNVDLAPTFADAAGIGSTFRGVGAVDGTSFMPVLEHPAASVRKRVLLEHLDYPTHYHVPSYCGLRTRGWTYVRYASGFQELYRLGTDPYQLQNLAPLRPPILAHLRRETRSLCRPLPPGYRWP